MATLLHVACRTRLATVLPRVANPSSAHVLTQRRCTYLAKRVTCHATPKNVTHEKFDYFRTLPNDTQHVATGWPNACNILRPTILQYVGLLHFTSLHLILHLHFEFAILA